MPMPTQQPEQAGPSAASEEPIHHVPIRRKRAVPRPVTNLNLTAMIDVVFLLLLYFLLVTNFAKDEEALRVDLPDPLAPAAVVDPFVIEDLPVVVTVTSVGNGPGDYRIHVDQPAVGSVGSFADLCSTVQAGRFDRGGYLYGDEQVFLIRAASETRWEHTIGTFNALVRAGFAHVHFLPPTEADP
ncbi:MAG: biopolymer transporter ExbD [Phycisphaerales bacterium]|nr:biopolymer transporter ExbD [Phycisphaerales bacterium]